MKSRSRINAGQLLVSIGLAALGIYVLFATQAIASVGGYSQVGPRAFPYLIGSGLLILGAILTWQAVSGGWRNEPERPEHATPDWPAFAILSAAVVLHMAAIGWAGFILASTFLFALVARGFGSTRLLRDIIVGAVLATAAWFLFTYGLGLSLPSGLPKEA